MSTATRLVLLASLVAVASLGASGPAHALDAGPWDEVLQAHAHRGGVDYAALKADEEAMAKLDRFLEGVATMSDQSPLADWLNAYNALVVKAVVERYPLRSVRDVSGFFDTVQHRVAGRRMTLDHLEHQLIRPRFPDARVHFALNCAAVSCPALYPRAFRQGSLDRVLDRLAQRGVANRLHVQLRDGKLHVSKLFEWFGGDFERDGGGSILGWIKRYDARDAYDDVGADVDIVFRDYDWRLNDRPQR